MKIYLSFQNYYKSTLKLKNSPLKKSYINKFLFFPFKKKNSTSKNENKIAKCTFEEMLYIFISVLLLFLQLCI